MLLGDTVPRSNEQHSETASRVQTPRHRERTIRQIAQPQRHRARQKMPKAVVWTTLSCLHRPDSCCGSRALKAGYRRNVKRCSGQVNELCHAHCVKVTRVPQGSAAPDAVAAQVPRQHAARGPDLANPCGRTADQPWALCGTVRFMSFSCNILLAGHHCAARHGQRELAWAASRTWPCMRR